jgi:hypothetical protein
MMKKTRYQDYRWMAGLFVLLMFLLSCESKDKYVGVYQAQATSSAKQGVTILELKANGDGLWKVGSRKVTGTFVEVPFTWHIKRGDLRVYTKKGGVIVGKIEKDTIQITLPGSRALTFRKTQ